MSKIKSQHTSRQAYVYVRQSSPDQVRNNLDSQQRQYSMRQWAIDAGWPETQVVVVDDDQGKTGATANSRPGFGRLLNAVSRGEVGIVCSLEASRLARNSPDWHQLLYFCRWTDTLVADEHGVYDLNASSDRLVLGVRGQMSEMEMDSSIHRLVAGRWNKAKRGGYLVTPPPGYDLDELGNIVQSSDELVVQAIAMVFDKFDEIGSAAGVFKWWVEQGLKLPVRRLDLRTKPIGWREPVPRLIRAILHNPTYTGAYAFGRTHTVAELDQSSPPRLRKRIRGRKLEDWPVLIRDHHTPYISFEKFEANLARMRANNLQLAAQQDDGSPGPVRGGQALLQGLARCGKCGRTMFVSYGGSRAGVKRITLQYRCVQKHVTTATPSCQLVGGMAVDNAVSQAFLAATAPAQVEAMQQAAEIAQQECNRLTQHWALQVERAQYEADRSERQYQAVEPENRTVARALERRWEGRLAELAAVQQQAKAAMAPVAALNAQEIRELRRACADLGDVWSAPTTTARDRKQLLRCLIFEVQLRTTPDHFAIRIVWQGGATTDTSVPHRARGTTTPATSEDTIELVRRLAIEFDDAQVARILNKQGRLTGKGNPFTQLKVHSLRGKNGIPTCKQKVKPTSADGPFTADETAAELGVHSSAIQRWLRAGLLTGEQATPGAPWRITLTAEQRKRLSTGDAPPGWVGLTEAATRLGVSKAVVDYWVKTGKIKGCRTEVRGRQVWKIDVSSAPCKEQPGLFDQMRIEKI